MAVKEQARHDSMASITRGQLLDVWIDLNDVAPPASDVKIVYFLALELSGASPDLHESQRSDP